VTACAKAISQLLQQGGSYPDKIRFFSCLGRRGRDSSPSGAELAARGKRMLVGRQVSAHTRRAAHPALPTTEAKEGHPPERWRGRSIPASHNAHTFPWMAAPLELRPTVPRVGTTACLSAAAHTPRITRSIGTDRQLGPVLRMTKTMLPQNHYEGRACAFGRFAALPVVGWRRPAAARAQPPVARARLARAPCPRARCSTRSCTLAGSPETSTFTEAGRRVWRASSSSLTP